MSRKLTFKALAILVAIVVIGCNRTPTSSIGSKTLTIAVIPKGTSDEFWKSVYAGSLAAAKELAVKGLNVNIIWKGPLREDDREQQIQVVEGFISQGVNGIVLAPLDERALVRPVDEAKQAGIPTVIIDSALQSNSAVSFVATDNIKGGQLAAQRLGESLKGKGKILLLRYMVGSASTQDREEGFLNELKAKYPDIQVVSDNQHAGATRDTAKGEAENLLNRFGNDVQGIFTPNESSTAGMLLALQDIKKAGNVSFVGFDTNTDFLAALRNGQMQGFVVQNPYKMGYLGVQTMVDHLLGKPVQQRVDTGVMVITPENIDSSEVKELIKPPVA